MGWPEFADLIAGLFSAETRMRRYFAPTAAAAPAEDPETPSPTEGT